MSQGSHQTLDAAGGIKGRADKAAGPTERGGGCCHPTATALTVEVAPAIASPASSEPSGPGLAGAFPGCAMPCGQCDTSCDTSCGEPAGQAVTVQSLPVCTDSLCEATLNYVAMTLAADGHGTILRTNRKFAEICRVPGGPAALVGQNLQALLRPMQAPTLRDLLALLASTGSWRGDLNLVAADGADIWIDATILAERSLEPAGALRSFRLIALDITAQKRMEHQVARERDRRESAEVLLREIVSALPAGIIATTPDGRVVFDNEEHRAIYRDRASPALESGETALPADRLPERRRAQRDCVSDHGEGATCGQPVVQKLPNDRWIQIRDRRSSSGLTISVQTDVTELKLAERRIRHQAETDSLTGLTNRSALFAHLDRLCSGTRKQCEPFTIVLIDLDGFKGINDLAGHDAGDQFLQKIARNVREVLRRCDIMARFGGDEFAILFPGKGADAHVAAIIQRIRKAIAKPVEIQRRTFMPSASIGVASWPGDGRDPKELMKCADLALYECKKACPGEFAVYNESMKQRKIRHSFLTTHLRQSIRDDKLDVFFQPQTDLRTGRHCGFEALVRWQLNGEQIAASELIRIAEEEGLIVDLGDSIARRAFEFVRKVRLGGQTFGRLAINVAAAQLYDDGFPDRLATLAARYGIPAGDIEIEVTENVILDRSPNIIANALNQLKARGFGIALDDFGTGYASLTHLKRFPLDVLKIDKSFVSEVDPDATGRFASDRYVIARTIVSLAHSLGLDVVAEGIETEEQYRSLIEMGCDIGQGYLIGKPMSRNDTRKYIRASQAGQPSRGHRAA